MKQKNYEKGITLIALVITIIVLLILAGVTINIVINQGIIDKSQTAVDEYKVSEYKENIELIKTGEYLKKINDESLPSLKQLVAEKLENETWVKVVKTSEDDAGLEENQIKVITKDKYIIVAEIEEDGKITYITIERDNGEPYPSLDVIVLPLEGKENEKVKIQVKAEVEKIKQTKKIAKIELILGDTVIETRSYNELKVEDIFEVEENGTYRIKAITDQEKSTSKKAIVNIQGTENIIQITSEPTTARNIESIGTKNGIATGPITVTIEYGETELQKQYSLDEENWINVEGTSTQIQVTENITIVARYFDGKNSFKVENYNIQNVDNVEPTFTSYNATVSGTTITASATATDTASTGAASGIEGILRKEYKLNNGLWQTGNTFTISTPGEYTVYIKAIDKAGNETIVTKTVTATGYTVTLTAGAGIETVTGGKTILAGQSVTINATVSSGYTFSKWTITSGTGTIVDETIASTTVTPTSDITVKAIAYKVEYNIGDTVTIGEEQFYVLADSDSTQADVTLIAKYNLSGLVQTPSTTSNSRFFCSDETYNKNLHFIKGENLNDCYRLKSDGNSAVYEANAYAKKVTGDITNDTGRLLTYDEATTLQKAISTDETGKIAKMLWGQENKESDGNYLNYWLSTALDENRVYIVSYGRRHKLLSTA